jgi:hypothetical protein
VGLCSLDALLAAVAVSAGAQAAPLTHGTGAGTRHDLTRGADTHPDSLRDDVPGMVRLLLLRLLMIVPRRPGYGVPYDPDPWLRRPPTGTWSRVTASGLPSASMGMVSPC